MLAASVATSGAGSPAVGAKVDSFTLPDIHRRPKALTDYRDQKAIVVVFLGTECPLANLYLPTLVALNTEYAPRGVQFLAINSNCQDSFLEVSAHAQEHNLPFPVLKDFAHSAAEALGATRTPEAYLLDDKRVLRYRGRIDDQYGIGFRRASPTREDLKDALDAILDGREVPAAHVETSGCLIGRAQQPRAKRDVTFAQDVASVLQRRCQACHREGESAPFALDGFASAKAWSPAVAEAVLEERMPPWHADSSPGQFANDRRLPDNERDLILAWIDQGCPEGNPRDLPPSASFPQGWVIGTPDAVFEMPEIFDVPASGVLDYQRFAVDPGFAEDVWVQAAEARPGNRAVVHHILVYIQATGRPLYEADGTAWTLCGWAPGDMPAVYEPGTAKKIPAGAQLVFEVHYTPNGKAQSDRSSVGIVFAKSPPENVVEVNILANMGLRVPAGASSHKGELTYTFPRDATLLSFMPHMHLRGAAARYDALYPDGREETLLFVPDYDFAWQSAYRFAEPLAIPKGTRLVWSGWWDNSWDNPRNPDPTQEVKWGLQTWEEMQNGWMELVWQPDRS